MSNSDWKYYNHAIIPKNPPNIPVDKKEIIDGTVWNIDKRAILARWVSDFDEVSQSEWWYVIKDQPYDVSLVNAKRRYEVNKGRKNYYVKDLDLCKYKQKIVEIQTASWKTYPLKYRPRISVDQMLQDVEKWNYYSVKGVFSQKTEELCGFACINRNGKYIYYAIHKVLPTEEKNGINAALVFGVLESIKDELAEGAFICDGSRSIFHETNFQDYLEKYFLFRKAYCRLHIAYKKPFGIIIKIIYPIRSFFNKFDRYALIHKLNGILKMEEIARSCAE